MDKLWQCFQVTVTPRQRGGRQKGEKAKSERENSSDVFHIQAHTHTPRTLETIVSHLSSAHIFEFSLDLLKKKKKKLAKVPQQLQSATCEKVHQCALVSLSHHLTKLPPSLPPTPLPPPSLPAPALPPSLFFIHCH